MNELFEIVQKYHRFGYVCIPVNVKLKADGSKEPQFPGKGYKSRRFDDPEDWVGYTGIAINTGMSGVVAVDVDHKVDSVGNVLKDGLAAAEAAGIQLPESPITATTQSGGQHRLFRAGKVPVGTFVDEPVEGVDTRGVGGVLFVYPTVVGGDPDRAYRWDNKIVTVNDLPEIPTEFAELVASKTVNVIEAPEDYTPADCTEAQRAYALRKINYKLADIGQAGEGNRYEPQGKAIIRAVGLAKTIGADLDEISDRIREAYYLSGGDADEQIESQIRRALVNAKLEDPRMWPTADFNPVGFWESRPELKAIEQAAYARYAAPWAALGGVLVNVLAEVPPYVRLDTGVGELSNSVPNLFVAMVGASGRCKGLSQGVANRMFHTRAASRSPGSGQVIQDWFSPDEDSIVRTVSVVMSIPELSSLGKVASGPQANHIPMLCRAWSGEEMNEDTRGRRAVEPVSAGSYRIGMVGGIQPGNAKMFLGPDSAVTGLAQRMLWFDTRRELPEVLPEPPEPLKHKIMVYPDVVKFCEQAKVDIDRFHRADDHDPLDTHSNFNRCKVAFALAVLNGRTDVNDEDWSLAGIVMTHSWATRVWTQSEMGRLSKERRVSSKVAELEASDDAMSKYVKQGVQKIVNRMEKVGEMTRGEILVALKGKQREVRDEVIDTMVDSDLIVEVDGRYRLK